MSAESDVIMFWDGDWMECRGSSFISKAIRYVEDSVTNHGMPIYNHPTLGQVVLDQTLPRMKVTPIAKYLKDTLKGKEDVVIVRQTLVDPGAYIVVSTKYCADMVKKRPFYNVFAIIYFLLTIPRIKALVSELESVAEEIYQNKLSLTKDNTIDYVDMVLDELRNKEDFKVPDLYIEFQDIRSELKKLISKAEPFLYYCTRHWWSIWLKYGRNIAEEFYHVNRFTPLEAEKFCIQHCKFLNGYYKGQPSDGLYKMIQKRYQS